MTMKTLGPVKVFGVKIRPEHEHFSRALYRSFTEEDEENDDDKKSIRMCQEIILVETQRYIWTYKAFSMLEIGYEKLVVCF